MLEIGDIFCDLGCPDMEPVDRDIESGYPDMEPVDRDIESGYPDIVFAGRDIVTYTPVLASFGHPGFLLWRYSSTYFSGAQKIESAIVARTWNSGDDDEVFNLECDMSSFESYPFNLSGRRSEWKVIISEFPDGSFSAQKTTNTETVFAGLEVRNDHLFITLSPLPTDHPEYTSFIKDITSLCQRLGLTTGLDYTIR